MRRGTLCPVGIQIRQHNGNIHGIWRRDGKQHSTKAKSNQFWQYAFQNIIGIDCRLIWIGNSTIGQIVHGIHRTKLRKKHKNTILGLKIIFIIIGSTLWLHLPWQGHFDASTTDCLFVNVDIAVQKCSIGWSILQYFQMKFNYLFCFW